MKPATKTDPSQTTLGAQATEDPDLLAANGRAAVREVEIEIARILAQGLDNLMNDWGERTLASSRSAWSSPAPGGYKQELDPEGLPQFGLVAEQVEHVKPDLAARDEDGKVSTVRLRDGERDVAEQISQAASSRAGAARNNRRSKIYRSKAGSNHR
jgi:hypothetical protein